LRHVFDPPRFARVAATLFQLILAAELQACQPSGLQLGHPGADVVLDLTIEAPTVTARVSHHLATTHRLPFIAISARTEPSLE
jgi:hypothetical protein